jgi:hypothetical protein
VAAAEVLPWLQKVVEATLVETGPPATEQLLVEAATGRVTPTSREMAAVAGAGASTVEWASN